MITPDPGPISSINLGFKFLFKYSSSNYKESTNKKESSPG